MKIQTGQGTISLIVLIALYSISMVTSLPGLAISPILGDLETIFKGSSSLQLQMLESLPSFVIVPFVLLAGQLSIHANKKRLLTIGLSIFSICSIVYLFAKTMGLLLFISAMLGVGAGMVIPFTTGLIADYFSGPYRTKQLGIVSGITNLTLVLATLLAGFLANINWHLPFLVYCFSFVALVFVFFLKEKPHAQDVKPTPTVTPQKSALVTHLHLSKPNWPVKLMLFYFFITFLALTIPFNLSIYMENLHIGSNDASGTMISVFFLSMTVPGFFINKIISILKKNTNFIALVCIAIGLLLFTISHALGILTIGVILIGFGYGVMQPIIYDKTADSVPPIRATYALAFVMAMNYIAIIVYPFILQGLQTLFSANATTFPFILNTILAVTFVIFTYFRRQEVVLGMKDFK